MEIVQVCDAFGWDYEQFMRQPKWYIDTKLSMRKVEYNLREQRSKTKG